MKKKVKTSERLNNDDEDSDNETSSKKNTAVYVTGLPEDISLVEVQEHFGKVGVIMDDMFSRGPRIKLYEGEAGLAKGDALVVYLRPESVQLAIDILDESQIRPNIVIKVQEARFDDNHTSSTSEEKKRLAIDKAIWKKQMQIMQAKLAWDDAEAEKDRRRLLKYEKVVVLKHMFKPSEFDNHPEAILDLKQDIMDECERLGPITSVHVLAEDDELRREGICTVKFKDRQAAARCVAIMNGRYFDGRRIEASLYDGSFKIRERKAEETEQDVEKRIERFSEWIEESSSTDKEQIENENDDFE